MFDLGRDSSVVVGYSPRNEERMRMYAAPIAWGDLRQPSRESILRGLKGLRGGDLLANLLDTTAKIQNYAGMNFDRLPASIQRGLAQRIGSDGRFTTQSYLVVQTPSPS